METKDKDLVEQYAKKIVDTKMGTVAILFLESMRPLNFVGSQLLHIINPVLTLVPFFKDFDKMAHIMEERDNYDYLIERIEYHLKQKRG